MKATEWPDSDNIAPHSGGGETLGGTSFIGLRARYVIGELLGEGATGRVYRAEDRHLGCSVALKTLRSVQAENSYRIKKEFRALVDLAHPNLVQLFELVVAEPHCFFTMELVDGMHLLDWLAARPGEGSAESAARLRHALPQLVRAIAALHAAGKVHRDIKPSNVLVTAGGRLVLVDLGFASGFDSSQSARSQVGQIVGTIDYMAPEQARGEALTPAADWYSVGVILHQALTGRLPYSGSGVQILLQKRSSVPPPRVSDHEAPEDLWSLAHDLLETDPSRRPSHSTILRQLSEEHEHSAPSSRGSLFVGRSDELLRLQTCWSKTTSLPVSIALVSAPSGMGKSTLVERFLSNIERTKGAILLRSRCHHREHVPFKALDGIVDDLSRALIALPLPDLLEILPADVSWLLQMFPVLGRVSGIAEVTDLSPATFDHSLRHRAFSAFRELLVRLAARHPLALWIDDFQWSDYDSLALLRILQKSSERPGFLLILSYRGEEIEAGPMTELLSRAEASGAAERIELPRLRADEAAQLAAHHLPLDSPSERPELLANVCEAALGHPLFLREYALEIRNCKSPRTELEQIVEAKVAGLSPEVRHLLGLLAVAGRPVSESAFLRAPGGTAAAALSVLRFRALVRYVKLHGGAALEVAHDRIREIVLLLLTDRQKEALHAELGNILEQMPGLEPRELVDHFLVAGHRDRAARYALVAAEEAVRCLAFDRAVSLYRRALELTPPGEESYPIRVNLGRALESAGYGMQGAHELAGAGAELAQREPRHPDVVRLRAAAGERFIQTGFLRTGIESMQEALATIGLGYAGSALGAIGRTLIHLPALWLSKWRWSVRSRRGSHVPPLPQDLLKLHLVWSAGLAIGTIDAIGGMQFQTLHALLAYRTNSVEHMARALSVRAVVVSMKGRGADWDRAQKLQAQASRLAERLADEHLLAFIGIYSGVVAFFSYRWQDVLAHAERAYELCRSARVGTIWDTVTARWLILLAEAHRGRFGVIAGKLPDLLHEADERNDRYASACYRLGLINLVWLCADDPEEAEAQAQMALLPFEGARYNTFCTYGLISLCNVDLYRGDARRAEARLDAQWRSLVRSFQLHIAAVHCEMLELRARVLLACAARESKGSGEHERLLAAVVRLTRALAKNPLPAAAGYVAVLQAGIAAQRGLREHAIEALERAAIAMDQSHLELHAAAVRWTLASMVPPERRDALLRRATARMSAERIVRPECMAHMLVPACAPPPASPPVADAP